MVLKRHEKLLLIHPILFSCMEDFYRTSNDVRWKVLINDSQSYLEI